MQAQLTKYRYMVRCWKQCAAIYFNRSIYIIGWRKYDEYITKTKAKGKRIENKLTVFSTDNLLVVAALLVFFEGNVKTAAKWTTPSENSRSIISENLPLYIK